MGADTIVDHSTIVLLRIGTKQIVRTAHKSDCCFFIFTLCDFAYRLTMSNINNVKMITTDCPNITRAFTPGMGSVLKVPRKEEQATTSVVYQAMDDGTIDLSGVNDQNVAKAMMRFVVEHKVNEVQVRSRQHPETIQIAMSDRIATLATNVNSVRRPQTTLQTIGGVETQAQYGNGMNELFRLLGQPAYTQFHNVIAAIHSYAIHEDAPTRDVVATALQTQFQRLRDRLCVRLQLPQNAQDHVAHLNNAIAQRDATIQAGVNTIQQLQQQITTLNGAMVDKQKISDGLDITVKQLQQQVATLNGSIKDLQKDYDDAHRECERMRDQLAAAGTQKAADDDQKGGDDYSEPNRRCEIFRPRA